MKENVKNYPTKPDGEGYYYADEQEEKLGILTKDYPNGSAVKKVALSDGRIALVRKLKGRDFVKTKNQIQSDNTLDFETVNMSIATAIDGKQQPPEYYLDDLYQSDYSKIMAAYSQLNF